MQEKTQTQPVLGKFLVKLTERLSKDRKAKKLWSSIKRNQELQFQRQSRDVAMSNVTHSIHAERKAAQFVGFLKKVWDWNSHPQKTTQVIRLVPSCSILGCQASTSETFFPLPPLTLSIPLFLSVAPPTPIPPKKILATVYKYTVRAVTQSSSVYASALTKKNSHVESAWQWINSLTHF